MWSEKMLNLIQNFIFVQPLEEFDDDSNVRTKMGLKSRFKDNNKERGWLNALFLVENCLLSLPLAVTSYRLCIFMEQLSTKTKPLQEEKQAYSTCRLVNNSFHNSSLICTMLVWLPFILI